MNMKPKKIVDRVADHIEIYDLVGPLTDAIGLFKEWQRLFDGHGTIWSNLRIELDGPDYEGPSTIELRGDRTETEAEFKARCKAAKRRAARRRGGK